MEILKKLLFGEKITVKDERIGTLSSRIKSRNPSKEYSWISEHLLPEQQQKTVLILEGNFNGPYDSQFKSVYRIIEEFKLIIEDVDYELKKNSSKYEKIKNWKSEFYLAALTPNDVNRNEFEINFEPFDKDDTRYVSLLWRNGNLSEIEGE